MARRDRRHLRRDDGHGTGVARRPPAATSAVHRRRNDPGGGVRRVDVRPAPFHQPSGRGATALSRSPTVAMLDGYWSEYLTPPPDVTWYRPGGIVVDVGCGEGAQLTTLRNAGCRAVGLELAPDAARACRHGA